MDERSDLELVEKARNGDVAAFRTLVEQTQGMVYKVSFRFLRNQHDAEDSTQEVFLRLWKNLDRFDGRARLTTWLYRITANYCMDQLKLAGKRDHHILDSTLEDKLPIPGELIEKREMMDLVHEAASQLAPKQQSAFILRDLEGLSVEETCHILEITEGQLKSNLHHARRNMQRMIKREYLKS